MSLSSSPSQPRLPTKPWSADTSQRRLSLNSKVDLEKALQLPHLVKTGQFSFRTSVLGRSSEIKRRNAKSAPAAASDEPSNDFQRFLLDHKQVRRTQEAVRERTLLAQHRDVWVTNIKRLQAGSGALSSEVQLLLATLFKDISHSDSAKSILEEILAQLSRSVEYEENLRNTVKKLHLASRKTAQPGPSRRRIASKQEYQNARKKIESLRKLIIDGLESLETECDTIEEELARIKISPDNSDHEPEHEESLLGVINIPEKTTSPSSSPDLVSSDSGFKTDEGTRSSGDDTGGGSQSETLDPANNLDDEEEDDTTSEATLKNEEIEDSASGEKRSYERFDIAISDSGECIMKDCDLADFPHLEYEHYLADAFINDELDSGGQDDKDPNAPSSAMLELQQYFQQPRRWDMFDIDEVDESNLSPVTNSPIATCPRVTPLECLRRSPGSSSSSSDPETASITGTIIEMGDITELGNGNVIDDLKSLDLNIKTFSLPAIKPISAMLSSNCNESYSLEGSGKFSSAFDALESHYRTKVAIVTEKLKKHEEGRPVFLTRELKNRLILVKSVYPVDHPNYSVLWIDMFIRMVQPKLSSHQVKLADLWLRERTHLENQLMACRTDMERELSRTERRIKKVVSWMSDRSQEREARRDELDGQRMVCERLRDELGMMREVRRLRDEERERYEVVERQQRLAREREAGRAEAERREAERDKILRWKRNRIDCQNLARLQLEDDLRLVLRHKHQRRLENGTRVRFRRVQCERKVTAKEERRRDALRLGQERSLRLEALRRSARRRLGVQVINTDRERVTRMTKAAQARHLQVAPSPHILQPLFPISSWSQDDLARDQRLQLETELRERGLLANEYAVSQVLAAPPPSVHRPDQRSTIGLGTK